MRLNVISRATMWNIVGVNYCWTVGSVSSDVTCCFNLYQSESVDRAGTFFSTTSSCTNDGEQQQVFVLVFRLLGWKEQSGQCITVYHRAFYFTTNRIISYLYYNLVYLFILMPPSWQQCVQRRYVFTWFLRICLKCSPGLKDKLIRFRLP